MESTDPLISLTELVREAMNDVRVSMLVKGGALHAPVMNILVVGGVAAVAASPHSCWMSLPTINPELVLVILLLLLLNWENNCC